MCKQNFTESIVNQKENILNLRSFVCGQDCQINYKPGSVIKTYHFSRLKIALELKQLTLMTSQRRLFVLQLHHLYLVLLPVGFSSVHCYQQNRCALTTPFHPCHVMAVYFLWHYPQGFPCQVLSGTVSLWSPDFPL